MNRWQRTSTGLAAACLAIATSSTAAASGATASGNSGSSAFGARQGLGSRAAGSQALGTTVVPNAGSSALGSRAASSRAANQPLTLGSQAATTTAPVALGSRIAGSQAATVRPGSQAATGGSSLASAYRLIVPTITGALPRLSTRRPGLLFLLGDGSGSMTQPFAGQSGVLKQHALADVVNGVLAGFVSTHNVGGVVKERLDVLLQTYQESTVRSLFEGALAGRDIVSLAELADNPAGEISVDDGEGNLIPAPVWVNPLGRGGTPMRQAFATLKAKVHQWQRRPAEEHLVLGLHVTDGMSTDGDPRGELEQLAQSIHQSGGRLLMTNIHLSSGSGGRSVIFPSDQDAALFDDYGKMLYEMSSQVPAGLAERLQTAPGARMMGFNATIDQLTTLFEAGSSVAAQ